MRKDKNHYIMENISLTMSLAEQTHKYSILESDLSKVRLKNMQLDVENIDLKTENKLLKLKVLALEEAENLYRIYSIDDTYFSIGEPSIDNNKVIFINENNQTICLNKDHFAGYEEVKF